MAYDFNYKDAPLLGMREGHVPFKTGLQDYEGEKLECKIYRYKVADDIAVDVFIPKAHPTSAFSRGLLLNKDGRVIAWNKGGISHLRKVWVKDYLKTFNKKTKGGLAWVELYRKALVLELNDAGYHLADN